MSGVGFDTVVSVKTVSVCTHCKVPVSIPEIVLGVSEKHVCPDCHATVGLRAEGARFYFDLVAWILSVISLVCLYVGYTRPLLTLIELDATKESSLIRGVFDIFHDGKTGLGVFILVFSLIFPALKNIAMLINTSGLGLPPRLARWMSAFASVLSPWAKLEVFIFGMILILLYFGNQFVEIYPGEALSAYIAMAVSSIAASWFHRL